MKTMNNSLLKILSAAALAICFSLAAQAQSAPQAPPQKPGQKQKPAVKTATHKVWTDDDVSSLRTPADTYIEIEDAQAVQAASKQAASAQQAAPSKPAQHAAPPKLSNPKSVEDADKMIAWEQRDIDSQQEYVQRLQQELATAPADQKERLQNLIQERTQIIADTRQEQAGLIAQKKALQAKSGAGNH